ncbi:unnamed protein product [Nyctereutes procyonoides]|uniref:Peroxisomal membrane protein PEX13 n=1 Tax=Nyctereutes procyonoides TaxID=34880 RepID=A0A811Y6A7_NYCPR|nr:unnamed protein product [Nyctereutes procyonoides]
MASQPPPPPKPWETRRIPGFGPGPGPGPSFQPGQPTLTRVPPPILPRPSQQTGSSNVNTLRPAHSSFSSGYGAYGNSFYGNYSPYSYGYNGLGYNRLRVDDLPPSRFVQQAEESSRGAFQSIESIVHAFASVSMMMDATFSAVYNSFRAVFSAFALVRTIRYLYRRLQWMIGLRRGSENSNSAKSWPIFLFFAVILGGPYLIWKLLSTHNDEDDHVVARAEYDFAAVSEEEISFQQQPKVRGWLLASLDGQTTGLIPANYVKSLGKRRGRKAVKSSKISKQQQSFTNTTLIKGATAADSLDEQEAVPVAPDSTGKGGDKQDF